MRRTFKRYYIEAREVERIVSPMERSTSFGMLFPAISSFTNVLLVSSIFSNILEPIKPMLFQRKSKEMKMRALRSHRCTLW